MNLCYGDGSTVEVIIFNIWPLTVTTIYAFFWNKNMPATSEITPTPILLGMWRIQNPTLFPKSSGYIKSGCVGFEIFAARRGGFGGTFCTHV